MLRSLTLSHSLSTFLLAGCLVFPAPAPADDDWALTLYGARNTRDSFGDVVEGAAGYNNAYLVSLSLNRKIGSHRRYLRFEAEGQVVKHFDYQNNWEGNALLVTRWLPFAWDRYLDTSFAAGIGISVASETPDLENSFETRSRKTLTYLMFEFDFFLPDYPRWGLVARLHHRSGAFGLFDGVNDAANAAGFGLRYRF